MKKITKKQIEIVQKMYNGYSMFLGQDETSAAIYYYISKGHDNIYFRSDTFSRLLQNNLIWQQYKAPYDYILTDFAKKCVQANFKNIEQKQ